MIPYMGGKQAIAKNIVNYIKKHNPNAKYFYDLFGGGASITQEALKQGFTVIYNDAYKPQVELLKCLINLSINKQNGKYGLLPDFWYDYVDREQFFNIIKNRQDAYSQFIRIVYSFGYKGRSYLYSNDIELYKKNYHNLVVFKDMNCLNFMQDFLKMKLEFKDFPSIYERRLHIRKQIYQQVKKSYLKNNNNSTLKEYQNSKERSIAQSYFQAPTIERINAIEFSCWRLATVERINSLEFSCEILATLDNLTRINQVERFNLPQNLQSLECINKLNNSINGIINKNLIVLNKSYSDVEINTPVNETVIYCDPPYKNTEKYHLNFNHDDFNLWFKNLKYKAYLSEYNSDFNEVFAIRKRVTIGSTTNSLVKLEKLYCNKQEIKFKNNLLDFV